MVRATGSTVGVKVRTPITTEERVTSEEQDAVDVVLLIFMINNKHVCRLMDH